MRLTEVNIDRFGVWRDLDVPLADTGVNVFYGPNEAGKSTLMRFVRGVLYGFAPSSPKGSAPTGQRGDARGALRILHNGDEHIIRREADAGHRGRVRFDDLDWGAASEVRVRQVLRDTSESLYENIFAIGLTELQELATLDAEEVAEHIYGLSLGPDGERILRSRSTFEKQRRRLLSDDRKAGEIVTLARRIEEFDRQLAEIGDVSQKHQLLRADKQRLTSEIETIHARRADVEDQLRGHRFLDRVYGPWKRERQLRAERDALPRPHNLPSDALARFDQIERDLINQQARRESLIKESERLDDEADAAVGDGVAFRHEYIVRRLSDYRDDLGQRERRLQEKQSRVKALEQKLQARLGELGSGWSVDRLSHHPFAPNGINRLWDAAKRYRSAVAHRGRTVRRYKSAVAKAQRRQADFNERIKSLGGKSLADAIRDTQHRLNDLRELNRLRIEEAELTGRSVASTGRRSGHRTQIRELPSLFYLLMWFFSGAGIVLAVAGLWGAWSNRVAGGDTAWIIGLIYFCFGVCMAGTCWTVKQHLEQYENPDPDMTLESQSAAVNDRRTAEELADVRKAIRKLVGEPETRPTLRLVDPAADDPSDPIEEADVIARTAQRLAHLRALEEEEREIQHRRHRLSRYRAVLRERQRTVAARRREWCDTLRELGIGETLKVAQALQLWNAAQEAQHLSRAIHLIQDEMRSDERSIEDLRRQIERLVGELPKDVVAEFRSDVDQIISGWTSRASKLDVSNEKRAALRRQAREKRREAEAMEAAVRDLQERRASLLIQAGVASREELVARMQNLARYRELERRCHEAQAELRTIAESEPNLAIVEEDLLACDEAANRQTIARLEAELKQITRDSQTAHQELGRIERELQELAGDRREVSLRFEREQVAAQLAREIEAWCSLDLSIEAVDHIRHRMERYAQSQTLQLASQYLDRLTCGKYPNVWTPLGERHLCIDDDAEQTLRVEQLSTGTREQLFLAIRLAIIRRFAEEGVELPMVLDDVFVNFDHIRTEAAVETILDFAEQGQQILLFTCHLHLAHMFEAKGIDPVWLPANSTAVETRRAG